MKKIVDIIKKLLFFISVFLLIVATFSLKWAQRYYGNIGFAEIVFTLNMPLKGTAQNFIESYLYEAFFPAVFIMIIVLFLGNYNFKKKYILEIAYKTSCKKVTLLPWKKSRNLWLGGILGIWFVALLFSADSSFQMFEFVQGQITRSNFIEEEYVDPREVNLVFPEQKKNLIYIWVESLESSLQDMKNGGLFAENYISELTTLAKDNISFSQSELLEGAVVAPGCGWTMAGIVAETAGIPLKLYTQDQDVDNSMGKYSSFLPGAVSLGDILKENGYKNYFMQGSNIKFGGKESYFKEHGEYEIWDYNTAIEKGKIPEDYYVWWGYEDAKLFQYAKEQLVEITQENTPFNFTMLTVDSHHYDGYICELCKNEYPEKYANVYQCVSRQLDEFIEWVKQQEFYENTTIVVVGDHCSMNGDFFHDENYDKYQGSLDRKVYNAFINAEKEPVKEKNRKFTTMDFYPTILSSLGVEIEGNRLGLGTNLFSGQETLVEEYGYEYVFEELNKKSNFYDQELLYP